MTSHFKFYPGSSQVVFPANAMYTFPTQANKTVKTTPRIQPKNGATFTPGNTIRLEFPAQGYLNVNNTTLVFDVDIFGYTGTDNKGAVWIQNNIQELFNRVRMLYGPTPLEDEIDYNVFVRLLTETTSSNNNNFDQCSINEGIAFTVASGLNPIPVHARSDYVHSRIAATSGVPNISGNSSRRRYQVQLMLGMLTQTKLIPLKWMAAQLAIEITLEQAASCLMGMPNVNTTAPGAAGTGTPTYQVSNISLLPEILEFDASYDAVFYKGLSEGGIPLVFNRLHTYQFSMSGATANILIPERSRSVKYIFTIIRRQAQSLANDSHVTFGAVAANQTIDSFQYRVGGRYFPASPVQVSGALSGYSGANIGGCEAYVELAKCLNSLGDYKLSTAANAGTWNPAYLGIADANVTSTTVAESDGRYGYANVASPIKPTWPGASELGRSTFCLATNLETSNGAELAGLNAEEQSDISLQINWSGGTPPAAGDFLIQTFVLYDAIVVVKPNNVVELIE